MEHQQEAQVRTAEAVKTDGSTQITPSPNHPLIHPILQLQQSIGNRALQRLLVSRGTMLQHKLVVGAANDPYEQEADRVARQVMGTWATAVATTKQGPNQRRSPEEEDVAHAKPLASNITPLVNRTFEKKDGVQSDDLMQGKLPNPLESFEPEGGFEARLSASGTGNPLSASTLAFMEERFGADFSEVRLHTGSEAAHLSRAINAQAFSHGRDIYFAAGKSDVESSAGKQLLAHELTHTIQQGATGTHVPRLLAHELTHTVQQTDALPLPTGRRRSPLVSNESPFSARRVSEFGSRKLGQMLTVQRQEASPAPQPPASPEERQGQLYAATILREVPEPDPQTKANLGKVLSFAPVYEEIQDRDNVRKELESTKEQLDTATETRIRAKNSAQDVSGAPGGTGPDSGEPEKAAADLAAAIADEAHLSAQVELLASELKEKNDLVTRELAGLGVKDEKELQTFVEETFPNSFVERGKQIAVTQLEANRKAAEKERERYKAAHAGSGDRKGLQDACRDLDTRTQEIGRIAENRYTTLPPGGADPSDPGVQELKEIQEKIAPKQEELEKKRTEYQLKYPILFKLNPQQIASASDDQLDAILEGPVNVVLDNIEATEKNIEGSQLKIWKLKAAGIDLPRLTKEDMGIKPDSTLDMVIEKKAADDKTTGEIITQALNALSLVADTIALVTGPIGVAVAGGIAAVAAVANVVQDYQTYSATQAAGNVAIDPDAAKMAQDYPDLEGLIFSLAMAGIAALLGAGAIRQAVNTYRQALATAKDLESFTKLINEAALDDPVKKRLIAEATSQFAKAPVVDVKLLKAEFAAIGARFSTGETVSVARILHTVGEEALAKWFLEMEETKIFKLTPEAIEKVYAQNPSKINDLKTDYFGGRFSNSAGFEENGKAFIRPASYASVTSRVSHELSHALVARYEPGMIKLSRYHNETMAFRTQRQLLQRARTQLGEAVFKEAFSDELWLVDATDERIMQYLRDTPGYKLQPPDPPFPQYTNQELDQYFSEMIETAENKRKAFNAVASQLDRRWRNEIAQPRESLFSGASKDRGQSRKGQPFYLWLSLPQSHR